MYKLFYSCSWTWNGNSGTGRACIALSRDGVAWWRPNITAPERSPSLSRTRTRTRTRTPNPNPNPDPHQVALLVAYLIWLLSAAAAVALNALYGEA